jgi:hypothetical protein
MLKLATGHVVTHTFLSPTTKMVNVVLTDGEEDLRHPKHIPKPSATLLNETTQTPAYIIAMRELVFHFRNPP